MLTLSPTAVKVQYYKSDILRILKLIYERSEKRMTIDWVSECQPFQGKTHHLLFFRYMLWFKCIRRENTPRGELYIWISDESPTQIYDSVSEMFPEYKDEINMNGALVARDLVECVGEVRIENKTMITEPKNNIEKIMKYAETKVGGFRLSDAIRDLDGEITEKSISPILSELVTKSKKLYREHGNYYLPRYAPHGLTEYVEKVEVSENKKSLLKPHEVEILNIIGDSTLKLSDILLKMPSGTNYPTLHSRINMMCEKGFLEKMDRGRYRAINKLEAPRVEEIEVTSDRTLYEIQLDACNEKMEKLKKENADLQAMMDINNAQLKNTEEAHTALTSVINGLKALKTLNISSMN